VYIFDETANDFIQTFDYPSFIKVNSDVIIKSELFIPIHFHYRKFFIRIIGKTTFSQLYRSQLDQNGPLLAAGIESHLHQTTDLIDRLKALLQVARIISGVLDIDSLIPTIMEKANTLLKTERCSSFLLIGKQMN
jgi:hypothetical protein